MKLIKVSALVLCTASLLLAGCKSSSCCAEKAAAAKSCGMACCVDAKTDCAHCATCSAKK